MNYLKNKTLISSVIKSDLHHPVLNISEPVVSLINSLLHTEDWEYKCTATELDFARGHLIYEYYNSKENLRVKFIYGHSGLTCLLNWATNDEKEALCNVEVELSERHQEARHLKLQEERHKARAEFMALVDKKKEIK